MNRLIVFFILLYGKKRGKNLKCNITVQQHNISDQNRQSNNESGSVPVKSVPEDEVEEDYSPSGSSWEPTDKSSSSSEDSDKVWTIMYEK